MPRSYEYDKRKYVIAFLAVAIVVVYLFRLFDLQMLQDYKDQGDSQALLRKVRFHSRGSIYDRNGELLVYDEPAYDITFIPREVPKDLDTLALAEALNLDKEQLIKRFQDVRNPRSNP